MTNDTIGDMITRLRNANLVKIQDVRIPKTKLTFKIAQILKDEGFIQSYDLLQEQMDSQEYFIVRLKYKGAKQSTPYITRLKRISKPGLRVYVNKNEIPRVLGGIGVAILSTSKGLMTDRQARALNIGGEVLCYIW